MANSNTFNTRLNQSSKLNHIEYNVSPTGSTSVVIPRSQANYLKEQEHTEKSVQDPAKVFHKKLLNSSDTELKELSDSDSINIANRYYLRNGELVGNYLRDHHYSLPKFIKVEHRRFFNHNKIIIKFDNKLKIERNYKSEQCRILKYPKK